MATLEEMGPIDYVVVEWTGRQPHGEAMPHLIELVDTGVIRLLDLGDEFAEFEDARTARSSWRAVASPCRHSWRQRTPARRPDIHHRSTRRSTTMPGLLRGVARTAVIAGTATHVSNNVSRRQAIRWAHQEQHPIVRLRELGELHDQGILTDEEFAREKAEALG
jgi:hypothetical protein